MFCDYLDEWDGVEGGGSQGPKGWNICIHMNMYIYVYVYMYTYVHMLHIHIAGASLVAQMVEESACSAGDPGSNPRSGTSSGEGNGHPL